MTDEPVMRDTTRLTVGSTLAVFRAIIQGGEPWTKWCQKAYDDAQEDLRLCAPLMEEMARALEKIEAWYSVNGGRGATYTDQLPIAEVRAVLARYALNRKSS